MVLGQYISSQTVYNPIPRKDAFLLKIKYPQCRILISCLILNEQMPNNQKNESFCLQEQKLTEH